MKIRVRKITEEEDLQLVFKIRKEVFVDEQNCPPELEWEHEDESNHFLAEVDSEPVGAARWRKTENGCKLERFAVLQEFRGKGVGRALLSAVLADLPTKVCDIYLHAQIQAYPFYEKQGFVKEGGLFEEAGIQHYKMIGQKF